ncbi:NTP transferase domain-containing protein [uncultured Slackia sp.]|uniref:nucleotidyltransferase family protein n=1 Tax=uncultured Slackia sp. TaxID=665903 RepID=UPI0025D239E8|nr:NTP transferase domain-containing protein [uncultured Slackia sp.]
MAHAGDNRTLKHGCIVMASGAGVRFGGNKLMAELCGEPLVGHVVRATDGLFDRRVVVTRHADVAALCETLGAKVILHDEPGRNDTVRLGMEAMDGCDTVTFVQGDQPLIRPASIAALLRAAERDAAAEHHAAAAAGRDAIGAAGRDAEGRDAAEDYDTEHDAAESGVDVAVGRDAAGRDAACVAEHDAVWRDAAGCGVTDVSGRPSARIWRTCFDGAPGAPVLFPSWAFDELRSLPHGKGGGFVAKMHAEYVRTIEVSSEWELFDVDTRDDLQQLRAYVARCGM